MSRPLRIALIVAGIVVAAILLLALAAVLILRSEWFHEKVRRRIVTEVEKATGGKAGAGNFSFNWSNQTAEIKDFVLRGNEPPGSPPLFTARRLQLRLNIQSVVRRKIHLESLDVYKPEFHLIVYPDGGTNIPKPKVSTSANNPVETILDLAIGHFTLEHGIAEINSERKPPFDIRAEDVNARFDYNAAVPSYQGEVVASPVYLNLDGGPRLPVNTVAKIVFERNRIDVTGARLTTKESSATVSGSITNLSRPSGTFHYDAQVNLRELAPYLSLPGKESGSAHLAGTIRFGPEGAPKPRAAADPPFTVSGTARISNWNYRTGSVRLRDFRLSFSYRFSEGRLDLSGVRFTGLLYPDLGLKVKNLRVSGNIRSAMVEPAKKDVDLKGIELAAMGGTFRGNAEIANFTRLRLTGEARNFELRRLMALVSSRELPYDALVSGPVRVEGALVRKGQLVASARLTVSPAPGGAPVRGLVDARYDRARDVLDLGQSYLDLPATSVTFSGVLGRQLHVHLVSTDLSELAPLLNTPIPIELQNGKAVFDGTVTGNLGSPLISGVATLRNFAYSGERFDGFQGTIEAESSGVSVRNAVVWRGTLRAELQARIGLSGWKVAESSPVVVQATVRNADLADLLALANQRNVRASGTFNATFTVSGTVGNPRVVSELHVANGNLYGQPFDRIDASLTYSDRLLELGSARFVSGPNEIAVKASYRHGAGDYETGVLQFQVATNRITLAGLPPLTQYIPELAGGAQVNAAGTLALSRTSPRARIEILNARISGQGLHIGQQAVGDFLLTAYTKGGELFANLESDFADSKIRGSGKWLLAGDYPGKAEVTFTRIELTTLRRWISPGKAGAPWPVIGYAAGNLAFGGPLLSPANWTASLTLPTVEIAPAPGLAPAAQGQKFMLRNQGPVQLAYAGKVIRVTSAHFAAMGTDLSVTGNIDFKRTNPLDLQIKGRVDLAMLQNFNRNLFASGFVMVDAGIRGALSGPQVVGQLELKNASFNLATLPNGISNANGVIQFSGNHASIQNLTAESGGGTLSLQGFAAYQSGELVFRVEGAAKEVRVRYPAGVSTTADAHLVLTGTSEHSILSGTVTVTRTGFMPNVDATSVLTASAEPVRTAPARTGFLAGMQLDVQVQTSPDVIFQSSLAQGVQFEANLRLRGTVTNPALLGRIVVTQGEIVFFGTKYTVEQGSVNFFNPVRIEPVLNVDLQTRVRGIDIILTVSGPMNKLTITPRSDPPLPFPEIVALLTTGTAPATNPATLQTQESGVQQSWQQMGASALLGQALANPVSGRLQRFFGITRLKIDPLISGVENNPQARLTIEQQLTPQVTLTYITNVNRTNPLVVRVEWAIDKTWSAVALRQENGVFGLDILYKRRF